MADEHTVSAVADELRALLVGESTGRLADGDVDVFQGSPDGTVGTLLVEIRGRQFEITIRDVEHRVDAVGPTMPFRWRS